MPLRCGICPLVSEKWADSTSGEQCTCPMKLRGYNILPATHECDVPIEDMRMDLKGALDYADMLQRAITIREAEKNMEKLTCGKCGLWGDQYETPWGDRIGRCMRKTVDTREAHECDVPLADLLALRHAVDKAIATREAEAHAKADVR